MLPTLRAAELLQERENLTTKINVLITSAVTSYLIPRYNSQDEFNEKAEICILLSSDGCSRSSFLVLTFGAKDSRFGANA
jgi:hypothetical protein